MAAPAAPDVELPSFGEVLNEIKDLPLKIALSKTAVRSYIGTFLLFATGLSFYGVAVTAYAYFYYMYIPNLHFETPVHLRYDYTAPRTLLEQPIYHPHGVSPLTSSSGGSSLLVANQRYDVSVRLTLPRSPVNLKAGNFMVGVSLLAGASKSSLSPYSPLSPLAAPEAHQDNANVLATSARPAILKYRSPAVEYARKALTLPRNILGWREETEILEVAVMEGVVFERGWQNLPALAWIELSSRERLHVYTCELRIKATLHGIRKFVHGHRIIAFFVLTWAFWGVEVITMVIVWAIVTFGTQKPAEPAGKAIGAGDAPPTKREKQADDMSDTERTFPTYANQPVLRYTSPLGTRVKQEDDVQASGIAGPSKPSDSHQDASGSDLSDEEADFVLEDSISSPRDYDSGLGTSMDSGVGNTKRRRLGMDK